MKIIIREATLNDYQGLCELYSELDELHRLNHPELFIKPDDYVRPREFISELINDNDKSLFVAEVDSKVVGLAECHIQESPDLPIVKKRKWVQLDSLAVKAEYQNYHIGTLLLQKVIAWAEEKKINQIEVTVFSFNDSAIEFYSHKGFKDLYKKIYLNI